MSPFFPLSGGFRFLPRWPGLRLWLRMASIRVRNCGRAARSARVGPSPDTGDVILVVLRGLGIGTDPSSIRFAWVSPSDPAPLRFACVSPAYARTQSSITPLAGNSFDSTESVRNPQWAAASGQSNQKLSKNTHTVIPAQAGIHLRIEKAPNP